MDGLCGNKILSELGENSLIRIRNEREFSNLAYYRYFILTGIKYRQGGIFIFHNLPFSHLHMWRCAVSTFEIVHMCNAIWKLYPSKFRLLWLIDFCLGLGMFQSCEFLPHRKNQPGRMFPSSEFFLKKIISFAHCVVRNRWLARENPMSPPGLLVTTRRLANLKPIKEARHVHRNYYRTSIDLRSYGSWSKWFRRVVITHIGKR